MPPRFAYWTILIDDKPTAFRAREQEELLPTLTQLKRTNEHVAMKWYAQGRLWDSPDAQRAARQTPAVPSGESRGADWRPGGAHKDPRDRFKKRNRPERAWSEHDPSARRDREKLGPPGPQRPWRDKPGAPAVRPPSDRPWTGKPRDQSKPWTGTPRDPSKPWTAKPHDAARPPRDPARPWTAKPPGGSKPWRDRPHEQNRKPFQARAPKPAGPGSDAPRKRRDDE
jgi:hypothetical protein